MLLFFFFFKLKWLKLEELIEQKRMNETALNQRASLLSILLHQTQINNNEILSNLQLNATKTLNNMNNNNNNNSNNNNNNNNNIIEKREMIS